VVLFFFIVVIVEKTFKTKREEEKGGALSDFVALLRNVVQVRVVSFFITLYRQGGPSLSACPPASMWCSVEAAPQYSNTHY
jgi:hypothetical protein